MGDAAAARVEGLDRELDLVAGARLARRARSERGLVRKRRLDIVRESVRMRDRRRGLVREHGRGSEHKRFREIRRRKQARRAARHDDRRVPGRDLCRAHASTRRTRDIGRTSTRASGCAAYVPLLSGNGKPAETSAV